MVALTLPWQFSCTKCFLADSIPVNTGFCQKSTLQILFEPLRALDPMLRVAVNTI